MLRDNPNQGFAVYLLTSDDKYAVCGTDFLPNQLLCRKYFLWRRLSIMCRATKISSFIDMQIWDEPCRLQTPLYDDTQGNINRRENRGKQLKNVGMNFSPTCRQKPERQCSTTIYCQRNLILQRQKKYIVFIISPAENRFCCGKKIFGRSSWPATCFPLFWALIYKKRFFFFFFVFYLFILFLHV